MTEKMRFSIENIEEIPTDERTSSKFATVSVDFFASGKNLHDMYVTEETLMKTAEGIKGCPLVWAYDEQLDDVYTHDPDETPCGFVPDSSEITSRILEDGRVMLSVVARIWKRYTGGILEFFKRDGGVKPVSVEMQVFGKRLMENGLTELTDFEYECITVLGSFVNPAIPLANANVLSFSDIRHEYEEDFKKEFRNISGLEIPEDIKLNVRKAISLRKKSGIGLTSTEMALFSYVVDNKELPIPKAKQIVKHLKSYGDSNSEIDMKIYNGSSILKWATSIVESGSKVEKEDKNLEKMEKNMEKDELKTEEMAEETFPMSEEVQKPEESFEASPEKEEMAEEVTEEKKFEFPANFEMEKLSQMFSDDEDEDDKKAKEEFAKGEFADPKIMMGAMFAKMCKMAELVEKMSEASKAYMSENEALKKFKAEVEVSQKAFEVEKTLKELGDKVVLSAEAKEEMMAEAEKFSFSELEAWKTECKAKSFEFAVKTSKSDVVRVGMPFSGSAQKKTNDLWS